MGLVEFDALLGREIKFEEIEDEPTPKKSSSWIKSFFNSEREGSLFELVSFQ